MDGTATVGMSGARWSMAAGRCLAGFGAVVLAGWACGRRVGGSDPMSAQSAVALALLSVAMLEAGRCLTTHSRPPPWIIPLTAAVGLWSLLVLCGAQAWYLPGSDSVHRLPGVLEPFPGRVHAATATAFLFCSAALALLRSARGALAGQVLALAGGAVALSGLTLYAYGIRDWQVGPVTPMALPTAAGLMCLAIGLLQLRRDEGPAAEFAGGEEGGRLAKWLLPGVVALPLATGGLGVIGARLGVYPDGVGVSVTSLSATFILVAVIWLHAAQLNRLSLARRLADTELAQLAAELDQRIAERTAELADANRKLGALLRCHQVLMREEDEQALLTAVCEIVAREAGYRLAWIGRAEDDDGQTITPLAMAGGDLDLVVATRPTWADTPQGARPVGEAIRSGHAVAVDDIATDPRFAAWRAEADELGFAAALCLPLRVQGRVWGVLALYASERGVFTPAEVTMLGSLADDLSRGLGALLAKAAQTAAEAHLVEVNAGLEQRVAERTRELEAVSAQHLEARRLADEANRAKSEFVSRMSHELRTPLNAILGFAQLLEMDELPGEQANGVQHILVAGRHLLDLINEVLDMARVESGRLALSIEPVQVSSLAAEMADLVGPLADRWQVHLVVEAHQDGTDYVLADRQRFKQVLLNLLSNGIKYNHRGGEVALSWKATGPDTVRLSVRDTGPGITASEQERLWVPFDRLGADEAVEGTGLGLALSQRLMAAMGGTLGLDSQLGQGSTFWAELPVAASPLAEELEQEPPPPAWSAAEMLHTVLYIEDNLSNAALVAQILMRRPAVRLVSAMQGRLGLALAEEHHPGLVLLDLNLPDMPGQQVLQRLRADPALAGIPVVIVSADATPSQIARLTALGASDYLTKPLDVGEFLRILDRYLVTP